MKDREFIELLNLYLDHEISDADAVRLEAEVQANPQRRATYLEYCRIQKACQLLAAELPAAAKPAKGILEPGRQTPGSESKETWAGWRGALWGAGGLAAAASLILVLQTSVDRAGGGRVRFGHETPHSEVMASGVASPQRGIVDGRLTSLSGASGVELRTGNLMTGSGVTDGNTLALSFSRPQSSGLRMATPAEDQLEWVRNFQLVSLAERNRITLPHFEAAPKSLRPDARAIRFSGSPEPAEETAAFRFQR